MCNRYRPARLEELAYFGISAPSLAYPHNDIGPFGQGVFLRWDPQTCELEAVVGQWGLIGWFAKTPVPEKKPGKRPILTNNARFETIHKLPTYREPWANGQRCIIPAASYVEPCWETGKNQWWRFMQAEHLPWGIAGIWNTWKDKETGELVESYSMVTVNADRHPLLSRMHRANPERPSTQQDKRAIVPLAPSAFETWLKGSIEEASAALVLPSPEQFDAGVDGAQRSAGTKSETGKLF